MTPRHLAITMGDPAGIGPEIIVKAAKRLRNRIAAGQLKLMVIGSNGALEQARAQFAPDLDIPAVEAEAAEWPALCALQAGPEGDPILPGQLSADAGRFAYLAIERGVRLAQAERIGGIVTAPLNKRRSTRQAITIRATPRCWRNSPAGAGRSKGLRASASP